MNEPWLAKKGPGPGKDFLLVLLPVLFFFLHNANRFRELIFSDGTILLMFAYAIVAVCLYILFLRLFRLGSHQAAVIAALAMTFFLFFGSFQDLLLRQNKIQFAGKAIVLLTVAAALIGIVIRYFQKNRSGGRKPRLYLLTLFAILTIYESAMLVFILASGKSWTNITRNMTRPVLPEKALSVTDNPDIYHIVFDGYTHSGELKAYWNYDNDLDSFLSSNGFFIVDSGTANYNFTPYSMGSVFNLQYLRGAEPYLARNAANFFVGLIPYRNNELFEFLKQQHYKISVFSLLNDPKQVEGLGEFAPEKPVTWLRKQTLERIWLNPWITHKIRRLLGRKQELPPAVIKSLRYYSDYNKQALDYITSGCRQKQEAPPAFTYVHFMLPHEPYVFDENGAISLTVKSPVNDKENYLSQVKYANKLIRRITECLLADSSREKIIILQGDHGYRSYPDEPVTSEYKAFNAFYFYDHDYSGLKKDISHVNTYRVIANHVFKTTLPLLTDSIVLPKQRKD